MLEQAGIDALDRRHRRPDVYPMPSVHPFHILVNEADLARARDVLAQYDTVPDDADDDD